MAKVTFAGAGGPRRTIFLSLAIVAVAAAVTFLALRSGTTWVNRAPAQSPGAVRNAAAVADADDAAAKYGPSPEVRRAAADRALVLRGKWIVWARAHRDLLARLRSARPNDAELRDAVYAALPTDPTIGTAGMTGEELGAQQPYFNWLASTRAHHPEDAPARNPAAAHMIELERKCADIMLAEYFAQMRDVAIADRVFSGGVGFTLWASGRVTEDRFAGATKTDPACPRWSRTELAPPFDTDRL